MMGQFTGFFIGTLPLAASHETTTRNTSAIYCPHLFAGGRHRATQLQLSTHHHAHLPDCWDCVFHHWLQVARRVNLTWEGQNLRLAYALFLLA